jgi:hypothetical protein
LRSVWKRVWVCSEIKCGIQELTYWLRLVYMQPQRLDPPRFQPIPESEQWDVQTRKSRTLWVKTCNQRNSRVQWMRWITIWVACCFECFAKVFRWLPNKQHSVWLSFLSLVLNLWAGPGKESVS